MRSITSTFFNATVAAGLLHALCPRNRELIEPREWQYRFIASGSYGPDEIKAMTAAYETALVEIGLVDRDDPLTELIANSVLTITATGERDPKKIKERALRALGTRLRDVA